MIKRCPEIETIAAEIHARPHPEFSLPYRISHLALLHGPDTQHAREIDAERAQIAALCERYNASAPAKELHWTTDLGVYRLVWERHTEFSTYSFMASAESDHQAIAKPVIELVPSNWIGALRGDLLVACHFTFIDSIEQIDLQRLFNGHRLIVSGTGENGAAIVRTALQTLGDGFGHYLIENNALTAGRAGRLAQRLMEIETYRTMALLGLSLAREIAPDIATMEQKLAEITTSLRKVKDNRAKLDELLELASETERMQARTAFRFGATKAYGNLVTNRLQSLREQRVSEHQPLSEFLGRRFEPALLTCASMAGRLDGLSRRIARTANLVRTKVDLELQEQNRSLLHSMEKRASLQLRLQQTVEGLSIAAISYYTIGLIAHMLKGVDAWLPVPYEVLVALSVPAVIVLGWLGLRQLKKRMLDQGE